MIELAEEWIEEYKDNEKVFEIKNVMLIDGVMLTWSYDCLVKEKEGDEVLYHLIDFKTTANLDYYSNRVEKKQVQLYAYIIMKEKGLEKIKVSYQIYVKWKDNTKVSKARKTKLFYMKKAWIINQIDYIDDIENKVLSMIEYYRLSRELDYYPPSPTNEDWSGTSHCWFCPLRNQELADLHGTEMCPAKKDNSFINPDWEIDFNI